MLLESNSRNTLTMLYYSLTTLSTVGFGDYSPVTTAERCFITVIFMMMLIVFSTIIDSLQRYFMQYQAFFTEPEQSTELTHFFQLLKRYNNGVEINYKFRQRIEQYFEKWWEDHRIYRITREDLDNQLFNALPSQVNVNLLRKFIYHHFFEKFARVFQIQRNIPLYPKMKCFYNDDSEEFKYFVVRIIESL